MPVTIIAGAMLLMACHSSAQQPSLEVLSGEWIFVEDLTEGRTLEQLSPPMGSKFTFRTEEGAVVLVSGHGGARREVKVRLDGSTIEEPGSRTGEIARYRGAWKDNAFTYEIDFVRSPGSAPEGLIKREFRPTANGLIVRSNLGSKDEFTSVGRYQHSADIPLPTMAKATITDLKWLSGNWQATRGTNGTISTEERWSAPAGGGMLATSRTISRDRMTAFEFLRIVERDGSLVYIAQPGGAPPTEFYLTQVSPTQAVFENPRHDYPKRIVYQLQEDGSLAATIGQLKGGSPRKFEFKRNQN